MSDPKEITLARLFLVEASAMAASLGQEGFYMRSMSPYLGALRMLKTYAEDIPGFGDLTVDEIVEMLSKLPQRFPKGPFVTHGQDQ